MILPILHAIGTAAVACLGSTIKRAHHSTPLSAAETDEPLTVPKLRTLLFSTLYPSTERPLHGIFVETRLRELLKTDRVDVRVVAPVPWFPVTSPRFGERAAMARTPRREMRHGVEVLHPRYPHIPGIGRMLAPFALAAAARPVLRQLIDDGFDFDVIDAHFFYPDGVAAAMLGRYFNRPVVITARGSDINVLRQSAVPRRMIQWAGRRAAASIGVSQALANALLELELPADRVHTVRSGVDLERFKPSCRLASRNTCGVGGRPVLLSVGNLVPLKGHAVCIDALALLLRNFPDARLVIVGAGRELRRLQQHAVTRRVADKVRWIGPISNEQLAPWYNAADVLLLASSSEGGPNVVLEALACGTPVVATAVGGVPEILAGARGVRQTSERSGAAFAEQIRSLLATPVNRAELREHASGFRWELTSYRQLTIFDGVLRSAQG